MAASAPQSEDTRVWIGRVSDGHQAEHEQFLAWLNGEEAHEIFRRRRLNEYTLSEQDGMVTIVFKAPHTGDPRLMIDVLRYPGYGRRLGVRARRTRRRRAAAELCRPTRSRCTGSAMPEVLSREQRAALVELRRDFHRFPELAHQEHRTAGVVAERLRALGLDDVREGVGKTGVVGVLRGGRPGKTVLCAPTSMACPSASPTMDSRTDHRTRACTTRADTTATRRSC